MPVATGKTKIGISEWPESQLEETSGSYLTAAALDNDGLTMAAPLLDGADYAIVPILAQVEYPADGSSLDLILPDSVTLLDYYGAPAEDAESLLHNEYSETSAAVLGVYVQADANFTAQLVYTAPDGSTLTKTLQVAIDRNATAEYPFPDSEIAAFAERPTPAVTSGKITKVAKVNGTWLIWFNGEPAYCCTPGADGQPKNCPTYTYVNTSMVGADQYVPGDHYGKRLWEQPTDKGVLAYHIIQSFSPGEATPDQVHEIGCEFARRFLADRFECTVSTHLDKGHLHNHIVVNSVSYADGKMFRNNFDTYYHGIRQVSDELCRENRLSVIETDGKGKSYDEWLSGQTGKPTIRGMVRKDVEQAIAAADSFDGFITELQNMGYTVKYGPRVEHMAVRHKDAQRNIRIDRLDPRFSETALREYYRQLQRLADYLYGRGRLGSHITSGNAALVLQTLLQARAVLTAKDWDKFGRRVNKGAKGIPQLVRVNGYYNVGSIFDVSMTYGNKPYPIPEIKPEQMDKAIKELERLSPVNIIFQNEGVVGYDAEQHAIVFPTAMPQREVLARLPAEIVIATAEQHTPGISQAPYLRKTAMAVSVEFCGRFSLPMPDTAAAVLDGMDTHIPPGEERKTLEEIRELSVTIGDTVEKALGLQRGQSAPQRDEAR